MRIWSNLHKRRGLGWHEPARWAEPGHRRLSAAWCGDCSGTHRAILSGQRGTKSRGKAAPGRSRRALVPIGERFEAVELDSLDKRVRPCDG